MTCLRGLWGVGKTFAWNRLLQEAKKQNKIGLKRYAYVLLFGLNSLDDLKFAIFENTMQSSEIGNEPSLSTFKENAGGASEFLGRKGIWFLQQIPWLKSYIGGLGPVWFLSVKNVMVCLDDIERRGDNLSVRDVMGLASHLRERKGCKVSLILNDEALLDHKNEFEKYYEKVVDTSLNFAPTPDECARIAIATDTNIGRLLSSIAAVACAKSPVARLRA